MTTAPYDPRSGNTPDAKPLDLAGMRYQAQYKPEAPAAAPKYNTERIYDRQGRLVEVYTEGPNAGRGVDTNELVIQGEAPQGTVEGVPGSGSGNGPGDTGAGISTGTGITQDNSKRQSAYDLLYSQFKAYGLESLVDPLKNLITDVNVSPSEFTLRLRDTDPYKKRFAANADRIKNGLTALNEAEYLGMEDQYQNLMRNYGLPTTYYAKGDLGRQQGFEKLIANDVSSSELEDRIATAQQRVLNSNPEVLKALKQFYPDLGNADILAYALDPQNALANIKRKVTAAEIGGAALAQGLQAQGGTAESLAGLGITKAQAQQGYTDVASMAPRGGQLADIYKQGPYTQQTAEAEVFNTAGAAEATAKRKKLTALEQAAFSGSSGVGALDRDRSRYGAAYGQQGQY
jgi:hypothetical protein